MNRPKPSELAPDDSPIPAILQEVNRLQYEIYHRLRTGERRSSTSIILLDDAQKQLLKTLYHDMHVLPVINKYGYYELY